MQLCQIASEHTENVKQALSLGQRDYPNTAIANGSAVPVPVTHDAFAEDASVGIVLADERLKEDIAHE